MGGRRVVHLTQPNLRQNFLLDFQQHTLLEFRRRFLPQRQQLLLLHRRQPLLLFHRRTLIVKQENISTTRLATHAPPTPTPSPMVNLDVTAWWDTPAAADMQTGLQRVKRAL